MSTHPNSRNFNIWHRMRTSYICILFKFDTETLFDLGGFYCFSLFLLFSFLFPEISFAMPILPFATTRADEDLLAVAEVLAAAGGEKRISPPRAGRCWAPRDGRLQVLRELRPQCSCGLQCTAGVRRGTWPVPSAWCSVWRSPPTSMRVWRSLAASGHVSNEYKFFTTVQTYYN